ncbi:MAG: sugar phosphate isomerase/epimerase [Clostridia bacterium]|nr:sugar phosphate isomerase/epimerase [Clostridia bacterium]
MKLGLPTLVECEGVEDCARLAKRLSLDFIEINMSFPQYQTHSLDVNDLKRIMKEYGVFYTIHADEQLNPFDFNPKVSECYFDVMRDTIRLAVSLGIPVINMHLLKGVYVTLPGKVILLTDVYRSEYIDRVKQFIAMCEDEIGDAPLRIAIENVDSNAFTVSQIEALELFMNSRVFGLTLDIGHDTCLGGSDRHVFNKYPEKLVHLHLHDSNGKSAHLPLGSASVNVAKTMSQLKYGDTCLIEVKTIAGLEESVEYLKRTQLFTL